MHADIRVDLALICPIQIIERPAGPQQHYDEQNRQDVQDDRTDRVGRSAPGGTRQRDRATRWGQLELPIDNLVNREWLRGVGIMQPAIRRATWGIEFVSGHASLQQNVRQQSERSAFQQTQAVALWCYSNVLTLLVSMSKR